MKKRQFSLAGSLGSAPGNKATISHLGQAHCGTRKSTIHFKTELRPDGRVKLLGRVACLDINLLLILYETLMKFSDVLILMIKIILNVLYDALYLRLIRPNRCPKIESKMQSIVRLLIGSTRFLTNVGQVRRETLTQILILLDKGPVSERRWGHGPTLCINWILDIKGKESKIISFV